MALAVKQAPFIFLFRIYFSFSRVLYALFVLVYKTFSLLGKLECLQLFNATSVQGGSIAARIGHVLLIGSGEVMGTAEVGLGAHI